MSLAELFPDADYRFHLTLRRGEPREFFSPTADGQPLLAERARWLAESPRRYAALEAEGAPLFEEFAELCAEWGSAPVAPSAAGLLTLGAALEPDFLLLSADAAGAFRLHGGVLCFPTGWSLEEKLGQPLDVIHGVVPGLNPALASPISQFLTKLRPGVAFLRANWGLAATDRLNLHPIHPAPVPTAPVDLDRLWLRVEHQALVALPRTRGVVFGIRIALHRLDEASADPAVRAGLRRALGTMSPELAAYKRLDLIRDDLIRQLS